MPHTLFECKIFIPRIGRNSWQNRFRRAKQRRRESRCYPRMGRLQAVIAYRAAGRQAAVHQRDRKSTRLNSSHQIISYAVFCLKKKKKQKKKRKLKKKKKSKTLHLHQYRII